MITAGTERTTSEYMWLDFRCRTTPMTNFANLCGVKSDEKQRERQEKKKSYWKWGAVPVNCFKGKTFYDFQFSPFLRDAAYSTPITIFHHYRWR